MILVTYLSTSRTIRRTSFHSIRQVALQHRTSAFEQVEMQIPTFVRKFKKFFLDVYLHVNCVSRFVTDTVPTLLTVSTAVSTVISRP